jgi:hypothetical protein
MKRQQVVVTQERVIHMYAELWHESNCVLDLRASSVKGFGSIANFDRGNSAIADGARHYPKPVLNNLVCYLACADWLFRAAIGCYTSSA